MSRAGDFNRSAAWRVMERCCQQGVVQAFGLPATVLVQWGRVGLVFSSH